MILRIILYIIISLIILFLAGYGANRLFKIELYGIECLGLGFVTLLGVLEFFSWFVVAFRLRMLVFEIIAALIILLLIIIGIQALVKLRPKRIPKTELKWILLVIGVTIIFIVLTFFYYRSDADDSFYVSNVNLFANSEYLNVYDSSFGNRTLGTVPMYDFQIWESLMAFIVKVSGISAPALMHTACVPVLLIASASSFFMLGRVLLNHSIKNASLFYLFISIFHLFSAGASGYSEGAFLLSRIWQGKAGYICIVFPLMLFFILRFFENKESKKLWLQLLLCIFAGIALNPTSLYVLGIGLLAIVVPFSIFYKRPGSLLHLIPSVITIAFFTVMIYLRTRQFGGQIEAASNAAPSFFWDTIKSFFAYGKWYIVIFAIAMLLILIKGSKIQKVYFWGSCVFLAAFVLNPLAGKFLAQYVTKTPSFWRLFWLLPIGNAISCASCVMIDQMKQNVSKVLIAVISTVLIIVPGSFVFQNSKGFYVPANVDRLPEELDYFAYLILDDKQDNIVLAQEKYSTTFRQKYNEIELTVSRWQYILDLFTYRNRVTEGEERGVLYDFINGNDGDYSKVNELLDKYRVNYVLTIEQSNADLVLAEYKNFNCVSTKGNYKLYQRINE